MHGGVSWSTPSCDAPVRTAMRSPRLRLGVFPSSDSSLSFFFFTLHKSPGKWNGPNRRHSLASQTTSRMSTPEIKGAPASTPLQGSHHDGLSYAFRDTTRQPHIFSHSTESFPSVAPPEYERVHGSDGPGHFESSDLYHTQPPASHRTSRYRTGWGLEATGLLITISAFIGLLVVLTRVDGQRLSTWTFPLSVNTVVSILSIILKTPLAFMVGACIGQSKWSWFSKRSGTLSAFVAFDEASRGPLGCLTLLWRLKSWWVIPTKRPRV